MGNPWMWLTLPKAKILVPFDPLATLCHQNAKINPACMVENALKAGTDSFVTAHKPALLDQLVAKVT